MFNNGDIKTEDLISILSTDGWKSKFKISQIPQLFQKIEIKEISENMNQNKEEAKIESVNYINFDDFTKVMLIVGTIINCEDVEGSDKLLKLQVDFGSLRESSNSYRYEKMVFSCRSSS